MRNILVIGATSAIAEATARLYARQGARFYLLARNGKRLENIVADLKIRGASSVDYQIFEADRLSEHRQLLENALNALGSIDIALVAHGTLGDQKQCESSSEEALSEFQTNTSSTISLLTVLANIFEKQGKGTLAVISSVAGDRGRPSNYVYGAAKAAVTAFCEGLQTRLYKAGVHLLLIKPGMVETPMTADLSMPKALVAQPEVVAKDIMNAISTGKDVLYTPWYWKYIMILVVHIPNFLFKKMNL
ncbi:MAG: SDR family oxidoreductase [Bacteroidales bacterium]|nr:SDR family oxidoreductase [Bacteroidales bacterium]NTV19025.1 SDR family oxidoreductase [Bacteroidales bacterium]